VLSESVEAMNACNFTSQLAATSNEEEDATVSQHSASMEEAKETCE